MSKKEKLLKILKQELSANHKNLLKMKGFQIVEQRDSVVFRMPVAFFALQDLWVEIEKIAVKAKIPVTRAEQYATVEELDAILTGIEWLWKGNIPKGFMTLVAGEPGIGKSLLVLDLAKIIITGDKFPNSDETMQASSVLWIDTEMKQQLLNQRSKTMIGENRKRLLIPSIEGNLLTKFDASNPTHIAHIIGLIEEKKPVLVVVDSLGHSHSKGENRIEEVRPIMDFFTSLARDYNIAVIVVHHLNKGREGESSEISMSRVRGSTDITATPVVIFALEKGIEDGVMKVRQIKNNIGREQPQLNAKLIYHDEKKEDIKGLLYSLYSVPPPKKTKKELCAEWVRGKLRESKTGMLLTKLVAAGLDVGFTRQGIYSAREILGDQITFGGDGRTAIWKLTELSNDDVSINQIRKANGNEKTRKGKSS